MRLYVAECKRPDGWQAQCTTTSLTVLGAWFEELVSSGQGSWFGNASGVVPAVSVRVLEDSEIGWNRLGAT